MKKIPNEKLHPLKFTLGVVFGLVLIAVIVWLWISDQLSGLACGMLVGCVFLWFFWPMVVSAHVATVESIHNFVIHEETAEGTVPEDSAGKFVPPSGNAVKTGSDIKKLKVKKKEYPLEKVLHTAPYMNFTALFVIFTAVSVFIGYSDAAKKNEKEKETLKNERIRELDNQNLDRIFEFYKEFDSAVEELSLTVADETNGNVERTFRGNEVLEYIYDKYRLEELDFMKFKRTAEVADIGDKNNPDPLKKQDENFKEIAKKAGLQKPAACIFRMLAWVGMYQKNQFDLLRQEKDPEIREQIYHRVKVLRDADLLRLKEMLLSPQAEFVFGKYWYNFKRKENGKMRPIENLEDIDGRKNFDYNFFCEESFFAYERALEDYYLEDSGQKDLLNHLTKIWEYIVYRYTEKEHINREDWGEIARDFSEGGKLYCAWRGDPEENFGEDVTAEQAPTAAGTESFGGIEFVKINGNGKTWSIGKFEITQKQYQEIMGENPSEFKGDDRPVENVSWDDARLFCDKLTAKYWSKLNGRKFALPSVEQWQSVADAELDKETLDKKRKASYGERYWGETRPVGKGCRNKFGLFDMQGNVWEWCKDSGDEIKRKVCGGSWRSPYRRCVSDKDLPDDQPNEFYLNPWTKSNNVGFRAVIVPIDEEEFELVKISEEFSIGKYEITQAQYQSVMGENPAHFEGGNHPVENVSYHDAIKFCERLTDAMRESGKIGETQKFTLPTSAQIKEITGKEVSIDVDGVWCSETAEGTHREVRSSKFEIRDVRDIFGNVWEWRLCDDEKSETAEIFGGSWYHSAADLGGTDEILKTAKDYTIGFRIAKVSCKKDGNVPAEK